MRKLLMVLFCISPNPTPTAERHFQKLNKQLAEKLIDNEPPEAYCAVDPQDEVFAMKVVEENGKLILKN